MAVAAPVTLLMAIHCHQPVGNFGFVFEEAYAKAYEPFLSLLERHPGVRLALHYSGSLLDWLAAHRPEFLRRVRTLARRGHVELLASGYYEPILPLLPEADRKGQIALMRRAIRTRFGQEPLGLWLTERVWEPELPQTLAAAGIRYTIVDTNQFAHARPWLPGELQVEDEAFWDLLGHYTTDYAGSAVTLFPSSKRLRYWLPFQAVDRTMEFLKRLQRDQPVAITFADDGEKFGFWPKTFQWVYEDGWLDQFFGAIERESGWLATETFRRHLERTPPSGHLYLPGGSYEEMLEWSGGSFRNFFIKYPEAQAMYHKMLRVSQELAQVKGQGSRVNKRLFQQAKRELYAGQCTCAYWHGVFGGLYLSHLRRAVYRHLIAAEELIRRVEPRRVSVVASGEGGVCPMIRLQTPTMALVVEPTAGGALTEWSLFGPKVNLLDTLSRRREFYHERLKAKRGPVVSEAKRPLSIHDLLGAKEENLAAHLVYDDHRRSAFLDYGLQGMPTVEALIRSTWGERRLWSVEPFAARPARPRGAGRWVQILMERGMNGGHIRKRLRIATDHPRLECLYELAGVQVPVVGIEWNLALRDERYLQAAGELAAASSFALEEPGLGMAVRLELDPPARLVHFPVETVSESEEGLERTYQGLCLMGFWTVGETPRWQARLCWTVIPRPLPLREIH